MFAPATLLVATHYFKETNLACVAWRFKQFFKQFESERTKRRSCEERPALITRIFYCRPPTIYFWQPDDRFYESYIFQCVRLLTRVAFKGFQVIALGCAGGHQSDRTMSCVLDTVMESLVFRIKFIKVWSYSLNSCLITSHRISF